MFGFEEKDTVDAIVESASKQDKPRAFGDCVFCSKLASGHVVVVGDAAHNIPPNIGGEA